MSTDATASRELFKELKPGDRVVVSSMEHNAVMRPLRSLEEKGLKLHVVPCAADGSLDAQEMVSAINTDTRLVVINHASNVAGTILPVAEIAPIAHRVGALLLVDAAQTAGVIPIDITATGIDLLVAPDLPSSPRRRTRPEDC